MNTNTRTSLGIKKIIVYAMIVIAFVLFLKGSWISFGDRTTRAMIGMGVRATKEEIMNSPDSDLEGEFGTSMSSSDARKLKKQIISLLGCMEDGAFSPVEIARLISATGDLMSLMNPSDLGMDNLFGSGMYGSSVPGNEEFSAMMRGASAMMMIIVIAVIAAFALSVLFLLRNRGIGPLLFAIVDTIILFLFIAMARISSAQLAQNMSSYDLGGMNFSLRVGAGGVISALLAIGACFLWGMTCSESQRSGVPIPWLAERGRGGIAGQDFNGVPYGHPGSNAGMWNPNAGSYGQSRQEDPGETGLIKVFCPGCGQRLKPGSAFCPACGRKM